MALCRCCPGIAHIQVTHVGLPPECMLVHCLAVGLRADTIRDTVQIMCHGSKRARWTCSRLGTGRLEIIGMVKAYGGKRLPNSYVFQRVYPAAYACALALRP